MLLKTPMLLVPAESVVGVDGLIARDLIIVAVSPRVDGVPSGPSINALEHAAVGDAEQSAVGSTTLDLTR